MEYSIYHIIYNDIARSDNHALVSSSNEKNAQSLLEKEISYENKSFKRIVIKKLEDTGFKFDQEKIVRVETYTKSNVLAKFSNS